MFRRWLAVLAAALVAVAGPTTAVAAPLASGDPPPGAGPRVREVVGGVAVGAGQYPWVVRLSVGCGGSLIAPRYVLTAAHCVPGSGPNRDITVKAATADLRSGGGIQVRSTGVRRAPGFRSATRGSDWAVIRLERALNVPTIRPAGGGDEGGVFTVLGWGATREGGRFQSRLRAARVPFVPDRTCAEKYKSAGYRFIGTEMICAGNIRRGGADSCQGDSGGPLVRRDAAGRWVQVGIVSWGHGCARPSFPGVYTQVSRFGGDIADAMRRG